MTPTNPRYASAQDAARAAAEAAQIIRRNEAQNVTERERHAHALAEVARLTSLEPVKVEPGSPVCRSEMTEEIVQYDGPGLGGLGPERCADRQRRRPF